MGNQILLEQKSNSGKTSLNRVKTHSSEIKENNNQISTSPSIA